MPLSRSILIREEQESIHCNVAFLHFIGRTQAPCDHHVLNMIKDKTRPLIGIEHCVLVNVLNVNQNHYRILKK